MGGDLSESFCGDLSESGPSRKPRQTPPLEDHCKEASSRRAPSTPSPHSSLAASLLLRKINAKGCTLDPGLSQGREGGGGWDDFEISGRNPDRSIKSVNDVDRGLEGDGMCWPWLRSLPSPPCFQV